MKKIIIKNEAEIAGIKAACCLTGLVFSYLHTVNAIKEGITTEELDCLINNFIVVNGGEPVLIGYEGYKHASCISINDEVCHGVPGPRVIKDGDIVKVDTAVKLNGYIGDMAETFMVGNVKLNAKNIVHNARETARRGVIAVRPGIRTGDVGYAMNSYAKMLGYTTVREFAGHGVGLEVHEAPQIPFQGIQGKGDLIRPGMIFTIEPMLCESSPAIKKDKDGWTVRTLDGKLSAQFEYTVLCTETGYEVLTY